MTHPRAVKGLASSGAPRPLRCRPTPSSRSVAPCRRSAGRCSDTTAPAVEWRTPTSILIAAVDVLVMRMTVSDADDPVAAKRARWAQNSARRHRRRALGDSSDDHPDSSPSSPVCVCAALPQPRSSRMATAARVLGCVSPLRMMAARERTASPV